MKLYILILLFIVNTQAFAQTLASKWASNVYETIIYISFDVTDQENGAVNSLVGTGFIISRDGYILTANHLFEDWHKQSDAQKEQNKIYGRIGGRDAIKSYPLEFIGDPDSVADVVLMKLRVSPPQEFQQLPLCFASSMSLGTEIVAYGFPRGEGIQATPGTIGNLNGPAGLFSANSDFTHGMSGGPVFNQDGVIGIIKGGLENEPAVRYVVPIRYAFNVIALSGRDMKNCDQLNAVNNNEIPPVASHASTGAETSRPTPSSTTGQPLTINISTTGEDSPAINNSNGDVQINY
jgi:S1-C subfamily serine protease